MWVLPVTLLVSLAMGMAALVALVWSLWTFYRIASGRRRARRERPDLALGWTRREKRLLAAAAAVVLLCAGGRSLALLFFPSGGDDPLRHRRTAQGSFVNGADGVRLHVEAAGRSGGGTVVLTHGWGADRNLWQYAVRDLAPAHRVVTWDLRGLGASSQPANRDYSLERMAADLRAIVASIDGPVVLAGHSIGGMINLTYARLYPKDLGGKVVGIAEFNSTYTNPLRTTKNARLATAIQKPAAEPLLYATIALSPLVRVLTTLRYTSGISHLQNAQQSFAARPTRQQLDFVSRYEVLSTPSVVARGGLGMFHWDASDALRAIRVPVLLIAGKEDTTVLPEASAHMREQIPGARLVIAQPAKHMGVLERNREYNAELLTFATACFRRDAEESARRDSSLASLTTEPR